MGLLNNLFTGADNETHDIGRVSWAACHVAVNVAALGLFVTGHPPTLMDFAGAHTAVVVAHGAALFAKQQTEPPKA